ncbi:DinB family protein [Luteipulveratus mongoliensis]|uniref:Pentapeptide repeat-containing protein n=1 Tax=Luteipulveratus mongoliensis TaxID=571913 RepID=A0A0K1JEC5_9MICO|nr:DinB family protein [Luteipulveratus mongoliensis]AKU15067.1 pentapeptide repeat-containing protein [Luteipulveratus mongoliensis]
MAEEFVEKDMDGARFEQVMMREARFSHVDLSRSHLQGVDLTGAVLEGVDLIDVKVFGDVDGLVINDVEVAPLITAELDRRDPGRVKMRATDPDGFREAWDLLERLWDETVTRARGFEPEQLHESVNGEWSFIETLRHLPFATDAWIRRGVLGDPSPWHPLDLPWDQMPDIPGIPRDREARPTLDEVLVLRKDRMATMRKMVDGLTDEQLAGHTPAASGPGWPPESSSFPVKNCLRTILNEEWEHRRFAERDLDIIESSSAAAEQD